MDQAQAKKTVIETFTEAFDKHRFVMFVKNLLNHLDDSEGRRLRQAGPYIKKAFKEKIKRFERLGTYTDPQGQKLDVLVIHLQNHATLERGRTSLRNFVADYLASGHGSDKDAVLAAFVSPEPDDWRFSYIKLEYSLKQSDTGRVIEKKELTPARRYSFLVGSNERSHTAQKQFLPLLERVKTDPTLAEIEKTFDIEKVTKEFFERYKDLFENVRDALDKILGQHEVVRKDFENKGIATDDFGKKLLGQIVFLYFLQKKGWFGVDRGAEWGTGNRQFLGYLFDHRAKLRARQERPPNRPVNFFNDVLEHLFYDALARERDDDYYARFDCRIPFLNGGLFEPLFGYDWVNTDILLPDELFSNVEKTKEGDEGTGILDVFDRYNFTVNEAEPLEKDVAVDPEMLGKVFENLLPENLRHKGGTYYTPRAIVNYMCQQSLINYLSTNLPEIEREDIDTFIRIGYAQADFQAAGTEAHKDNFLPAAVSGNATRVDKLLEAITVCDPALGSGAFPVGMMQEIVRAREALAAVEGMPKRTMYELKRHTIQNSLYGVDVDPSAVEIAKLRLWLSLVVDEDDRNQIQALPNLDYKIMQGNSLLDEFRGVKLLDDDLLAAAFTDREGQLTSINAHINDLQDQFFELDRKGLRDRKVKERFAKEIATLKRQKKELLSPENGAGNAQGNFHDLQSTAREKLAELKQLHREFFDTSSVSRKRALRDRLETLDWEFMEAKLKDNGEDEALLELGRHRRDNRKNYFLWKLHFVEVFQAKGGFDVVIGNPPYLESRNPAFSEEFKDSLQSAVRSRWGEDSKFIARGADLLIYFFESSLQLISREHGQVVLLTQNAWLDTEYGKKFQTFLLRNTNVRAIIDSDFKYFQGSGAPNINTIISVFVGREVNPNGEITFARFHESFANIPGSVLSTHARNLSKGIVDFKCYGYSNVFLKSLKWGVLLAAQEEMFFHLLSLLGKKAATIRNIGPSFSIGQGLNLPKSYLIKREQSTNLQVPLANLIPILTGDDGAPFELTSTMACLIDKNSLPAMEVRRLNGLGFDVFDKRSTSKQPPLLILPRGVSRHFCALNSFNAFSSSAVDIYGDPESANEEMKLNLWIALNSSICWLWREVSGRKNLGGGLLKAEAVDLESLPIYMEFNSPREVSSIFNRLRGREAMNSIDEIYSDEHAMIDQIVGEYLGLTQREIKEIVELVKTRMTGRTMKAKSG